MTFLPFRRLPIALRLLVLALVALGMAAQLVLSALGDMHQAAHDIAAQEQPAHDHFARDTHEADAAHDLGTPPLLHELLHLAHCCGHPVALSWPGSMLPTGVAPHGQPAAHAAASRREWRRIAPFRPPITA